MAKVHKYYLSNDRFNMIQNKSIIGILGGTYNPVHKGHVYVATALAQNEEFQQIRVVPCYEPVHRDKPAATPQARLKMVELAFSNYPKIEVDDQEIKRQGPSYAYDTMRALKSQFPETPLCWILGSDAFASFDKWHNWREFLNIGHLVIVKRPGSPLPDEGPCYELLSSHQCSSLSDLTTSSAGKIVVMSIDPPHISAHSIRHKINRGASAIDLLPTKIWQFIKENHLYQDSSK